MVDDNGSQIEERTIQADSYDGSIVQSDQLSSDQSFVVDEQVAFDRRPRHEIDAPFEERVVDHNPRRAFALRVDRSTVQEVERERQFKAVDQRVD